MAIPDTLFVAYFGHYPEAAMMACDELVVSPEDMLVKPLIPPQLAAGGRDRDGGHRTTNRSAAAHLTLGPDGEPSAAMYVQYNMRERQRQATFLNLLEKRQEILQQAPGGIAEVKERWKNRMEIDPSAPNVPWDLMARARNANGEPIHVPAGGFQPPPGYPSPPETPTPAGGGPRLSVQGPYTSSGTHVLNMHGERGGARYSVQHNNNNRRSYDSLTSPAGGVTRNSRTTSFAASTPILPLQLVSPSDRSLSPNTHLPSMKKGPNYNTAFYPRHPPPPAPICKNRTAPALKREFDYLAESAHALEVFILDMRAPLPLPPKKRKVPKPPSQRGRSARGRSARGGSQWRGGGDGNNMANADGSSLPDIARTGGGVHHPVNSGGGYHEMRLSSGDGGGGLSSPPTSNSDDGDGDITTPPKDKKTASQRQVEVLIRNTMMNIASQAIGDEKYKLLTAEALDSLDASIAYNGRPASSIRGGMTPRPGTGGGTPSLGGGGGTTTSGSAIGGGGGTHSTMGTPSTAREMSYKYKMEKHLEEVRLREFEEKQKGVTKRMKKLDKEKEGLHVVPKELRTLRQQLAREKREKQKRIDEMKLAKLLDKSEEKQLKALEFHDEVQSAARMSRLTHDHLGMLRKSLGKELVHMRESNEWGVPNVVKDTFGTDLEE